MFQAGDDIGTGKNSGVTRMWSAGSDDPDLGLGLDTARACRFGGGGEYMLMIHSHTRIPRHTVA